jgi:hypothetical protein
MDATVAGLPRTSFRFGHAPVPTTGIGKILDFSCLVSNNAWPLSQSWFLTIKHPTRPTDRTRPKVNHVERIQTHRGRRRRSRSC